MPILSWESPRKTTRAGEDNGADGGHHHSRCVLRDRGRTRARQAEDVRVLRNRWTLVLSAGDRSRRQHTDNHHRICQKTPVSAQTRAVIFGRGRVEGERAMAGSVCCDVRKCGSKWGRGGHLNQTRI